MNHLAGALRLVVLSGLAGPMLSACQSGTQAGITESQNDELTGDVAAYHLCVANAAARLDDGRSPIPEVADAAMDHCLPQAREVSRLLDSTKLPGRFKSEYLDHLLMVASRQSALMLRRRRNPDWDDSKI
jgi:hypothetical protein